MSKVVLLRGSMPHQISVVNRFNGDTIAIVENNQLSFSEEVSNDLKNDILATLDFWKIPVLV